MLKIVVVDETAESRTRLVQEICTLLRGDTELDLLPRVSVSSSALEELRHTQTPPHIVIVGREIITRDVAKVGGIKRLVPRSALFVALPPNKTDFETTEALARLGADDAIMPGATPGEFQRKIIFVARKLARDEQGAIVVIDSGKGGVGITSIIAALGDGLTAAKKSTVLVDFDFETQDLSRFLRARPFINEPLHLLLNGHSPSSREYVEECIIKVWDEPALLGCVPPPPETDKLFDPHGGLGRSFIGALHTLSSLYSNVLIDVGALKGPLLRSVYRAATKIVLVINNDPATVFASTEKLNRIRAESAPDAKLLIVSNTPLRGSLHGSALKEAFRAGSNLDASEWGPEVPYSKAGSRWAGSGETLYSLGGPEVAAAIEEILMKLNLIESTEVKESIPNVGRFLASLKGIKLPRRSAAPAQEPQQRLLPAPPAMRELISPPEELTPESLIVSAQGVQAVSADSGVNFDTDGVDDEELDPRKLVSGAAL